MIDKKNITGLILAGGRGSRMGNIDKGLQDFRGTPMVSHVLNRLSPQVSQVLINANQNQATYESFGVPVWPDALSGFAGPLAGMQAGLLHCTTPYLVTAPCDSPFLPTDLVARLSMALQNNDTELAVAVTGENNAQQIHPVFCLFKATLLPPLTAYLQSGGRKVDAWFGALKTVEVFFSDERAFRNINTLDDLEKFENA